MTSFEIRQMWLKFFANKNHHIAKSSSLIPRNEANLLWVNAGITPLKKYFDGTQTPLFRRITNVQKCIRTNDIKNVGKTSRHHTFFEMLGNFSIGNYFKKEAIHYAFELLTSPKWFAFPLEKLYITYFFQDQDTYQYWLDLGVEKKHLIPLKSNFWQIGPGPSGPCTEIFFDRGKTFDPRNKELIIQDLENDRFIEIWNIVFSQYNCDPKLPIEKYQELPSKNIDTGAGLERLACILQNTKTNFETDLFFPLIKALEKMTQIKYTGQESFKIIADHLKTLVFAINDGAVLTNEKRGYVLKKLLRRAANEGKKLGLDKPFLHQLVPPTVAMMRDFYKELCTNQEMIAKVLLQQENIFEQTLKTAEKTFLQHLTQNNLSGQNFFKLYDTYGIPEDLILGYAKKKNITTDYQKFQELLHEHQNLSKQNQTSQTHMNKQEEAFLQFLTPSEFIGYTNFTCKTKVIKVFDKGIVLEKTPFYANMGGQIEDEGWIGNTKVTKITKLPNGQILHEVQGNFCEGQEVYACIDKTKRNQISYHHTATHLLEAVLQKQLGSHLKKQGSSVGFGSLRYDFNHFEKITPQTLLQIEKEVNQLIQKSVPVKIEQISIPDTQKKYATLLEQNQKAKYKDKVRIVSIDAFSVDLCGGTHATNTKDLEHFTILSCESISSGIYRIEAVCNNNCQENLNAKLVPYQNDLHQLTQKAKSLQTQNLTFDVKNFPLITQSYQDILNYQKHIKAQQQALVLFEKKVLEYHQKKMVQAESNFLPPQITKKMMLTIEEEKPLEVLKFFMNHIFDKYHLEVLFLSYVQPEKIVFLCKSKTLHAGNLIKEAVSLACGSGGGNASLAQGGTKKTKNLEQVLNFVKTKLEIN
ncbi:MAG: alanine--tRNA ligase [Candidatus Phytoplasma sp. TWB_XP]